MQKVHTHNSSYWSYSEAPLGKVQQFNGLTDRYFSLIWALKRLGQELNPFIMLSFRKVQQLVWVWIWLMSL